MIDLNKGSWNQTYTVDGVPIWSDTWDMSEAGWDPSHAEDPTSRIILLSKDEHDIVTRDQEKMSAVEIFGYSATGIAVAALAFFAGKALNKRAAATNDSYVRA